MLSSILSRGEVVLTLLTHAAWQAALLALVVFGVTKLLGDYLQPRWRFGLWLVVFARLAIPVLPPAPWSVFRVIPHAGPSPAKLSFEAPTPVSAPTYEEQIKWSSEEVPLDQNRVPSTPKFSTFRLIDLAILVWVTGILVLSLRHAANVVQLYRAQRSWPKITDSNVLSLLRECCAELRCRHTVSLFESVDNVGPATCGIIRSKIVIPRSLLDSLSAKELRFVLLHEVVHVRRCDALVDQLITLITIVHWFHPIAWISRHALRSERELACDAAVLERSPQEDSSEYGHAILKTIELQKVPTMRLSGMVGMFNQKPLSIVYRRVQLIAAFRASTWRAPLLGTIVLFGLVLVGLTDAQSEPPKAKPSTKSDIKAIQKDSEAKPETKKESERSTSETAAVDPNIKLQPFEVRGTALNVDGQPIAGATIYLSSIDAPSIKLIGTTVTDKEGRFEFRDVQLPYALPKSDDSYAAGKFEIFGKSADLGFAWSGMQWLLIDPRFIGPNGEHLWAGSKDNVHLPNEPIDFDFTFLPPKPIRGRFLDDQGRAIQNVKVMIADCNYAEDQLGPQVTYEDTLKRTRRKFYSIQIANGIMPDQLQCLSDAEGRFELKSVPEGMVCRLGMQHPDYAIWDVSTGTAELLPKKFEWVDVRQQPIEMTRAKVRAISVCVRYRDTLEPAIGTLVGGSIRTGFYSALETTDNQGKAILRLPPDEYNVLAFPPNGKDVRIAETKLRVKPIDEQQSIDLFFDPK